MEKRVCLYHLTRCLNCSTSIGISRRTSNSCFFPKKELTGSDSPALYCQTNDANYNEKKIEQITCTPEFNKDVFHKKNDYEEISIEKVPQDIRTAILEPIKENFTEALIKYHQKKKA